MLAAVLLAAALPLGVWPSTAGPAANVIDDVEFYLVEPEDDYVIVAIQPLAAPLTKADPAALKRLTGLAHRLGADGVLLLGGLAEKDIPEDQDEPLPQGKSLVTAVFVSFDTGPDEEEEPSLATRGAGRLTRTGALRVARQRPTAAGSDRRAPCRARACRQPGPPRS
jgi:hypothetical protein